MSSLREHNPSGASRRRLACGLGQVAALTVHRAVIHYRALRFATLTQGRRDADFGGYTSSVLTALPSSHLPLKGKALAAFGGAIYLPDGKCDMCFAHDMRFARDVSRFA